MKTWAMKTTTFAVLTLCLAWALPAVAEQRPLHRGALSPSAPVELRYQMPEQTPAGELLALDLTISTPIETGALSFEVTQQENLVVANATSRQFDLAVTAQPLIVPLKILPGAEDERYLVLVLSVDTALGRLSRTFRITLPGPAPAPSAEPHDEGLKILPAE